MFCIYYIFENHQHQNPIWCEGKRLTLDTQRNQANDWSDVFMITHRQGEETTHNVQWY